MGSRAYTHLTALQTLLFIALPQWTKVNKSEYAIGESFIAATKHYIQTLCAHKFM